MEQHPDRQPGCAEAMQGGDYDYRNADQEFDGKGIYAGPPTTLGKVCSRGTTRMLNAGGEGVKRRIVIR